MAQMEATIAQQHEQIVNMGRGATEQLQLAQQAIAGLHQQLQHNQAAAAAHTAPSTAAAEHKQAEQQAANVVTHVAAAAPHRLHVKLPPPTSFTGNTSIVDGRNSPDAFMKELERYFLLCGVTAQQQVAYAAMFLKGTAATWWDKHEVQFQHLTFDQFKEKFLDRFRPIETSLTARMRLRTLKQKGSVESYNNIFARTMESITDMAEYDQILQYMEGLQADIRQQVVLQNPDTLDKAMVLAVRVETFTSSRRSFAANNRSNFNTGRGYHSSAPASSSSGHSGAQQSAPMELGNIESKHDSAAADGKSFHAFQQRLTKLTPAEREHCRKNGLCFRCRRHGHMSNNCPTKSNRPGGTGGRLSNMQQEDDNEQENQ